MSQNILYVSFLLGIKEKEFQLLLKSNRKLEAAGLTTGNLYELDISSKHFTEFYGYVKSKYGILYEGQKVLLNPDKAIIEQKKEVSGQPWKHLLIVQDNIQKEYIVFHPDSCGLENEEEDAEYQKYVEEIDILASFNTQLPEAYRDSYIKE